MKGNSLLRADKLLVERGLARSREDARAMIERAAVKSDGFLIGKAASMLRRNANIEISDDAPRWVSRGAHKLIKALDTWNIDASGKNCIDIGASTGGFTQVLLSRGAARVAAVDVGYGQMAWEVRSDPRVTVLEKTNARYLTPDDIGWRADIITVDASFISLRLLLGVIKDLLTGGGRAVTLVKPQFEVGRERVGGGVVRDPELHALAMREVAEFAVGRVGFSLLGAVPSPIRGAEGNAEFLFYLSSEEGKSIGADFGAIAREAVMAE
jgi:23S rRNA (cytidine1920-2'-O)/16S rRNA (cytidine1409-2'-O)-methyltransferase